MVTRKTWLGLVVFSVGLVAMACGDDSGHSDGDAGAGHDASGDGGFTSPVLDPDFGDNGVLRVQSTWSLDRIYAADLTATGEVLVGGTSVDFGHRAQAMLGRFTSAGEPDPTFGDDGFVLFPLHHVSEVTDVVALPDGGAVAVGTSWFDNGFGFAIRVDGQGALDPSFGDGGLVLWENYSDHIAADVDQSGAVIFVQEDSGNAEVRRLTPDGVLDATFSSGGITGVSGQEPRDLIALADGRILVLTYENYTSWVIRLTAAGDYDSTFGASGSVTLDLEAFDLAVHPTSGALAIAGNGDFGGQVVQLDADGVPVPSFGTDGVADVTAQEQLVHVGWLPTDDLLVVDGNTLTFPSALYRDVIRVSSDGTPLAFDTTTTDQLSSTYVAALLMGSDGMYFVGDQRVSVDTPAGANLQTTLLGVNHDGTPRAGFGQSGFAQAGSLGPAEVVWDMRTLSDGAVIVAGSAGVDPILVRFAGGALDTSYGTDGFAYGYPSQFRYLAIDDADRVVAVTWVSNVVRFLADGTVDESFGNNGHLANLPGQIRNLTIDAQQRIVLCGWEATGNEYPMVARYHGDGTPDTSFGDAGVVLGYGDGLGGVATALHVDPDGKILVLGESWPPMAMPDLVVARLNDDGTMDTSFGQDGLTALDGSTGADRILPRSGGGYLILNQSPFSHTIRVIALEESGQHDTGFAEGGVAIIEALGWPVVGILELDDGRILVAGGVQNGNTEQLAVWCLEPDGQLDTSFAEGGVFLLPGTGRATALVPDGDGVLVSSFLFHPDSGTDVALVRLLP